MSHEILLSRNSPDATREATSAEEAVSAAGTSELRPYTSKAARIERAISELEGWAFGRSFRFTTIHYVLHTSINGGWNEVDKFRELPGLEDFAKKLDAAIEPVAAEYAKHLRRELANECIEVAARAMGPKND